MRRPFLPPLAAAVLLVAAGCDGDGTAPPLAASLSFVADTLELDTARTARLTLRNTGALAAGPVSFEAGSATDAAGDALPGVSLVFSPAALAGLEAGESATVDAEVLLPAVPPPGAYTVEVRARAGDLVARSTLHLRVAEPPTPAAGVRFTLAPDSARQGDVVDLAVEATDGAGGIIEDPAVTWAVLPADAGLVTPDGRFVGYQPGDVRVVATVAQGADTALLRVSARGLSGSLVVLGRGPVDTRYTSDLWVHGAHAYTGTWGARTLGDTSRAGNTLYAWSIANPASPVRTDSVVVDATTVNDVKVSADGTLAVLTHEGSQLNGITLLDLADPAHPRVLSRFTEGLDHGVHNVWIEGGYVYAVSQGLKVIDVATPTAPRLVASVPVGDPFLHDVYVRDGLAFLSAWNEGLVILDVGNGIAAGAPTAPVRVGALAQLGGQTHNAWYWPERGYVFVGEEDFQTPGIMHVVDVRDLTRPREVATFAVPGDAPHNFWLDEASGILYMAWYSNGLRALDVSGELLGDLGRQGRELASLRYGTTGACPGQAATKATCTWAPQLHQGLVWVSDMHNGLLSIQPSF